MQLLLSAVTRQTDTRCTCCPSEIMLRVYAYTRGIRIGVPKYSSALPQLAFLNGHLPSKQMVLSELIPQPFPQKERRSLYNRLRDNFAG